MDNELQTIRKVLHEWPITVLHNTTATPETIKGEIDKHPWVHFACHGRLNAQHPLQSSFMLFDKELEILEVMEKVTPLAELAFLSVCHGAAVGPNTPDGTFSIATAMELCGFKTIVGTLWSMRDDDGPRIAESFYRDMVYHNNIGLPHAAHALHNAVRALRDTGADALRWSTFIHIGI